MNLRALRDKSRSLLGDEAKPYFWSNQWLSDAINEALREACIRARLIEDESSIASSIDIEAGVKEYDLHPSVIDVLSATLESTGKPASGWTLSDRTIRFFDAPRKDDVLNMRVVRLPMRPMDQDEDCPEIRSAHHEKLLDWVLHKAYLVQDADGFDPQASARHLALFEAEFGAKPTANSIRQQRAKTGRVVKMATF